MLHHVAKPQLAPKETLVGELALLPMRAVGQAICQQFADASRLPQLPSLCQLVPSARSASHVALRLQRTCLGEAS